MPPPSTPPPPDEFLTPPTPTRTIRRPLSHDSLTTSPRAGVTLRPASSLHPSRTQSEAPRARKRSSQTELRVPVPTRVRQEPTLLELMRAEEEREASAGTSASGSGSSERTKVDMEDVMLDLLSPRMPSTMEKRGYRRSWSEENPPKSAVLYPPLYGRPGPSPSPDIFATLLSPLLSLSRPPSPAVTPPTTQPSSPVLPKKTLAKPSPLSAADAEPSDRSSSSLPAHFPPRTPSDPGPTVESQGFVLYLGSLVSYIAFLVWSLLPDEWLEGMGVLWFPSREWALLVPAWTIMLAFFIYFSYIALNIFITPSLDSLHTLTGTCSLPDLSQNIAFQN
ncbi:phosphatidylinositol N-acetylglucosaminyltransferase subunit P [Pseudohyphozyma bogoriensis]|nr:phosphatidylinositol N-acetylglucosaminyltransferase subunit P [Pseudohyphozyma bogoriensis]